MITSLAKLLLTSIQSLQQLMKIALILSEIKGLLIAGNAKLDTISIQGGKLVEGQDKILALGQQILERLDRSEPEAVKLTLYARLQGETLEREVTEDMPLIQPVDRTSTWTIKATDKFGNPAQLDGPATFELTDPSQGSVAVSADGLSAVVTPTGVVGNAQLVVKGDADLGSGVKPVQGLGDISLVAGEAFNITVEGSLDAPAGGGDPNPIP